MTLSPINLFQCLLAVQALLFGVFLLSAGHRNRSHHFLAGFLLTLALHMGLNASTEVGLLPTLPDFGVALGFLYGPWIYLYTRHLAFEDAARLRHFWKHGIPGSLVLLGEVMPLVLPVQILAGAVTASLAAYLVLAIKVTSRFEAVLQQTRATGHHLRLRWLRHLIQGLLAIGCLDLAHSIALASAQSWSPYFYSGLTLALLILVNYMIFMGLQQPHLFAGISAKEAAQAATPQDKPSPHAEQRCDELRQAMKSIESAFEKENLDRDPGLTLERLSKAVDIAPRKVSEAINSIGGQSFSDYVNARRINAACRMLQQSDHDRKTILEILYEVGFNTKSNFYAAFKRKVGVTPIQFRRSAQKSRITQE